MTSSSTRVYVTDDSECPDNAILRRDENGALFYNPSEDGQFKEVGGPQSNTLFEDGVGKSFAEYEDMDDCISDNQDKDDPGAYCAEIHHEATGEWPAEKQMTEKVFVASEQEAPDGIELKQDEEGRLFYEKQQVYEHIRAVYSEDVEEDLEETGVEMPDPDDAGEGTSTEEDFDDELEDLRAQIHDVEDERGPENVA